MKMIDLTKRNFEEAETRRIQNNTVQKGQQISYILHVSDREFYTSNISAQKHTDMTEDEITYSPLTFHAV